MAPSPSSCCCAAPCCQPCRAAEAAAKGQLAVAPSAGPAAAEPLNFAPLPFAWGLGRTAGAGRQRQVGCHSDEAGDGVVASMAAPPMALPAELPAPRSLPVEATSLQDGSDPCGRVDVSRSGKILPACKPLRRSWQCGGARRFPDQLEDHGVRHLNEPVGQAAAGGSRRAAKHGRRHAGSHQTCIMRYRGPGSCSPCTAPGQFNCIY